MPAPSLAPPAALRRVSGAGTRRVRELLTGPPAAGTVVHAGRQAIYAEVAGHVLGVVTRGAVQVPCAIATSLPVLPHVEAGAPAGIADGTLRVGGLAVGVDRVVATGVVRLPDPAAAATRLDAALPRLDAVRRQLPAAALTRLADGDPAAVRALVGLGDGLTPVGDDVVSGWLATARAAGRDTTAVATAARRTARRTTALSAALLADAADGATVPAFRALLVALACDLDVDRAVAAVHAVGHTSGAGMLLGARLALPAPLHPRTRLCQQAVKGVTR